MAAGLTVRRQADLSAAEVRRIVLAAQGLAGARRRAPGSRLALRRMVEDLGLVQIDSVNVLARAHELPPFARLGTYPRRLLTDATERHRDLFEYWGHAACLMPTAHQPLWRWRMDQLRERERGWAQRIEGQRPGYIAAVLAEVRERGPIAASDLAEGAKATGPWWGWADGKVALEWLFSVGELSVAGRRNSFERLYDLTERVIPAEVLALPTPSLADAHRELVRIASRALGVATRSDLATYFYLRADRTAAAIRDLVESGDLLPVRVEGWTDPAWLAAGARQPRRVEGRALLAPFDPLVFDRNRVERLFGMRYRIEIYTPAPRRVFGYYVLPFLLDDRLVARVDLKADRARATLVVQAAHPEPAVEPGAVAEALAAHLRDMAAWLELGDIEVQPRGDLAVPLAQAVAAGRA